MADKFSSKKRSEIMASVKGADTKPEKFVRSRLFKEGFRYRIHAARLPGKPDIVLPRYNVAVFVHGCFWHGHNCPKGKRPATNKKFWNKKIDGNMERDDKKISLLRGIGWHVFVLWQCRLIMETDELLKHLKALRGKL